MSLASKALNLAMNWVIWRRYRRSFKRVWRRGRLSHGWGRRRMLRLFRRERNSEEMLGWWGVLWCVWVLFEMVPCLPIPNQAATSTHVAITKLLNLNPYSHNVGSFMLHSCRRTTGGNISISQHRIHPDNVSIMSSPSLVLLGSTLCAVSWQWYDSIFFDTLNKSDGRSH